MSLLGALLCGLKILFLTLSTVGVKNRCTTLYSDAINCVVFIHCNINTFCNGLLSARNNNSNWFKECIAENGFFT